MPSVPNPIPPPLNPADLVYHLDVLLAAIIACFVLFRLPRALARLSRAIEWTHGHILHSARLRRTSTHLIPIGHSSSRFIPSERGFATDLASDGDSHSHLVDGYITQHRTKGRKRGAKFSSSSYPPHIPACPAMARPLAPTLRYRITPGFSVGQVLILSGYFATLLYVTLVQSNPFTDPLRTGYVAVSQLPLVFAFAAKNSIVGMFLGLSYEKVIVFSSS